MNMQSRPECSVPVITNQTLHSFFVNSSNVSVMNVWQLPSVASLHVGRVW